VIFGEVTGEGRGVTLGGVVLTVNGARDVVERQLGNGELACPSCGGMLGGWGNGVTRRVRQLSGDDEVVTPRRSRCRGCRATHVLLPAQLIGRALEAKAAGSGHRAIAGLLGRPESTVRGWLRALARNAGRVRERFTSLAASLVTDPPLPAPAGSPAADAVAAVAAAAAAAVMLPGVSGVARWELASAVTCGLLLAPSWPAGRGNASWLWAAAS
jgi:AcrR family transcriptional regulator